MTAQNQGDDRASMRTVVAASSAGTAFEWYDFFIFGSLAQVISKTFFTGLSDTAGYVAALALFGVGFAFRPLGALVFGKIGDQAGRKGAFLATVLLMGGATFAIALLPTYVLWAPNILWKLFDMAIGGIQAFIFALLTVLYFAMARGTGHDHDDEHLDDTDDVTAASDEAASAQNTPVPAA